MVTIYITRPAVFPPIIILRPILQFLNFEMQRFVYNLILSLSNQSSSNSVYLYHSLLFFAMSDGINLEHLPIIGRYQCDLTGALEA